MTPPKYTAAEQAQRRAAAIARTVNLPAGPRRIGATSCTDSLYNGAELKPYAGRPDTAQAVALPSRTGHRLRWPDGRVTDLAGNLLADH